MAKIEIYIADELVDLPVGGIKYSTTYSIADISTIDQRNSSITKTMTLPATARNRQIFGFPDQLSSTSGIDQTVIVDARIDKEGTTVLSGVFKITDIVMNDTNGVAEYKGVIIGNNGAWKLPIKELKLTDLDITDQDHTYNEANITTSETLIDGRDYVYPLINYGDWYDGGTVKVVDRVPAVRIKRLVEQIFNDQGYKMESAFFDSDFGKRLFMPFTRKKTFSEDNIADGKLFRVGQGVSHFIDNSAPSAILDLDDLTSPGFFEDVTLIDTVLEHYVAVDNAIQNLVVSVPIAASGGTIQIDIQRVILGFPPTAFNVASVNYSPQAVDVEVATLETGFINVNAGDRFRVKFTITGQEFDGTGQASAVIDDCVFWNVVPDDLQEGNEVILAKQLPDMFQLDLIQAMKTNFNLYFDTNIETRTVTVEPFDDFFIDEVVDWSEKLDLNTDRQLKYIGSNQSKTIVFDYTDDSNDKPVQQILERDLEFAQHEDINTNVFAREGQRNVVTAFSPTLMATASTIGFIESLIPKMWNDTPLNELPARSTDYNPRILYYAGVTANATNESWEWEGTVRTDYPRMIFYDEINDNDENLMFKTLRRSHGLFEKYYRNSQKILNEGRVFTGLFNLNDNDISNLNFRKRVLITMDGELHTFILNKVSNYDGDGLTKVELITDVGTQKLTQITTEADDPNILPGSFTPVPDPQTTGIVATVNGVVVPVYSTEPSTGTLFWVQSATTSQGGNGR
jgi:hypothetical protein